MRVQILGPFEKPSGGVVCGLCGRAVVWVRPVRLGTVDYSMCRGCLEKWTRQGMVAREGDTSNPVERMCNALRQSPRGRELLARGRVLLGLDKSFRMLAYSVREPLS